MQAVYAYIESGIPLVGVMTKKEHAVAIIGHGALSPSPAVKTGDAFNWSVDYINDLIISNDNEFPFTSITRDSRDGEYSFDDLDYIVIPLYEKMYLNANVVIERIKSLVEAGDLVIQTGMVCRPYLTSVRSLKRQAYENDGMNADVKTALLKLPTPQFVWCADFVKPEDNFSATYCRIIIDATAGTYESEPWLLYHDDSHMVYFDSESNRWYIHDTVIHPYGTYLNNLQEFYHEF